MNKEPKRATIEGDSVPVFDNEPNGSHPTLELLTISEAAALLRVSVTSVRRLQQKRSLPFIKVGGVVRFLKSDLVSYLAQRRVEPIG